MRKQSWILAAALLAMSAGAAHAQRTQPPPPPPPGAPNQGGIANDPGFGFPDPRFGTDPRFGFTDPRFGFTDPRFGFTDPRFGFTDPRFGFTDPRFGFTDPRFADPRVDFFDPRFGFGNSNFGFTPGVTPGNFFVPGAGGVFFDGPFFSGPVTPVPGRFFGAAGRTILPRPGHNLPIVGVTHPVPPRTPRRGSDRMRVFDSTSGVRREVTSEDQELWRLDTRRFDGAEIPREERLDRPVATRPVSAQERRLANRMQDIMADRPMTSGTVTRIREDEITVQFRDDGSLRVADFAPSQVFFFLADGEVATASTDPDKLSVGRRVLVPIPGISASVAGSREELGDEGTVRVRVRPQPARKRR